MRCSSRSISHPVYSLIARNLRDPADAADVTQEVFVKVFRNISGFCGDSSLRTWIYRIALHEASNQRRWWNRHKRQETTIDAQQENEEGETFSLADALATTDASPYDCAARSEIQQRVTAALSALPQAFREVVVLREIEGFGYEEIAEILQVNLGTVKSRLTRGRAALRGRRWSTTRRCWRLPIQATKAAALQSTVDPGGGRMNYIAEMFAIQNRTPRRCEACAQGLLRIP